MRAVPVESFTVVMATGIVAVTARDNRLPLVRCVFAVGAACGLALIIVLLVVARIRTGRAVARGRNPFDRTFGRSGSWPPPMSSSRSSTRRSLPARSCSSWLCIPRIAPACTKVMNLVGSEDKEFVVLEAGHVGLLTGRGARKGLWPRVRDWLAPRSS